jgi:pimeloyl-ACP methyl ester carboxylesterase
VAGPSPRRIPLILLPGIIAPAALRFARLLEALGDDMDGVPKDLEVYGGPSVPPPGYSLDTEIDGIARVADEHRFDRFHLYGHSGGGACALAYTAMHPERVLTLALDEPATDFSPQDRREIREVFLPMLELPPDQQLLAFLRAQMREGVDSPPMREGPPPQWMADRPAGVAAFVRTLSHADVPVERLRAFDRPVYFSYGTLSNETWERKAERLGELFPNITIELFEGLSHLDPSHAVEPERVAAALHRLWDSGAEAE